MTPTPLDHFTPNSDSFNQDGQSCQAALLKPLVQFIGKAFRNEGCLIDSLQWRFELLMHF